MTEHGPFSGMGNFDKDRWQLFHIEVDRSEAQDLADQYPDKVKELVALCFEEAKKYNVFPLIDYSIEKDLQKILDLEYKLPVTPERQIHLLSGNTLRSRTLYTERTRCVLQDSR